eukprot:10277847-Prorocentrum_lima.AAC.1
MPSRSRSTKWRVDSFRCSDRGGAPIGGLDPSGCCKVSRCWSGVMSILSRRCPMLPRRRSTERRVLCPPCPGA